MLNFGPVQVLASVRLTNARSNAIGSKAKVNNLSGNRKSPLPDLCGLMRFLLSLKAETRIKQLPMNEERFTVNTGKILFTNLDDEGVIFDMEKNTYLNLNPTFSSIFSLISEGLSVGEVKIRLMTEYKVDAEICEAQLHESIQMLLQKGFIIPAG